MSKIEVMDSVMNIVPKHKVGMRERCSLHVHNCYELFLSLTSNCKFFVGEKIYEVNKYDVFLFNTANPHRIGILGDEKDYERYVIMIPLGFFQKGFKELEKLKWLFEFDEKRKIKISLQTQEAEQIITLIDKMIQCENDAINRQLKTYLYLTEILIILDEHSRNAVINEFDSTQIKDEDERIEKIMKFIRLNSDTQISLDSLSKKFFFNKQYLCRLFKKKTGFNIGQYIESCRISSAMTLLGEGYSISEVAIKVGFGSDTYFISTFKKNIGVSPKKYVKDMIK